MWDDKDIEAELEEEIKAELDKISVSSLEISEETYSPSDVGSGTDSVKNLPESVLYCIKVIKNQSKNVENLVLQDLEDSDISSPNYGAVSNNPTDFLDELTVNFHENALELKKRMLLKIQDELQTNLIFDKVSNSAEPPNEPANEHLSKGDTDTISFGYVEVEEKCRQSFAAWEDKQRKLENKENEKLKAQRDRDEQVLKEEEEKIHCRMKQFEIEKKRIENIHKKEEEKINIEMKQQQKLWEENLKEHEEFIRQLQLKMDVERRGLEDLKTKESQRLSDLQHNAATKIQARYRTFVAYQKYGSTIKERVECNKRKKEMLEKQNQEWKEMVCKFRQKDEERKKKADERQKRQDEINCQRQKEHEKRQEEYEKKKNMLKWKKEQEMAVVEVRKREEPPRELKGNKKRGAIPKEISVKNFTRKEDIVMKPLLKEEFIENKDTVKFILEDEEEEEERKKEKDIAEQKTIQKLKQESHKENISRQPIMTELKKDQNDNLVKCQELDEFQKEKRLNDNLAKDSNKSPRNIFNENTTNHLELEKQREKGSLVNEDKGNECQEIREDEGVRNDPEQNRNKQDQEEDSEIIKEEREKNGENQEEEKSNFKASLNHVLSLVKESNENIISIASLMAPDKESEPQALENGGNEEINILTDGKTIILNTADIVLKVEGNICKQNIVSCVPTPDECSDDSDRLSSTSEETTTAQSVLNEMLGGETPRERESGGRRTKNKGLSTNSLSKEAVLALVEEKRLAWIKACQPWLEIFRENQNKKVVTRNRPRKSSVSKLPPLNSVAILQGGLWTTLQQVTTVTFRDLPGCSLSTLSECTSLQFLTLRHCGLTALEGLNNCKKLKYIDVQENQIQVINCENLENLCILLLNDNEITSFHGLDGCSNLRNIEVSYNKITRIGGLESLKSLQQLIVDHNLLMSTRGLCSVPTIMYLDCSYNNLTKVEGITDCGLLQILKLQGNYLSELPSLKNHVLLRELYLDDNSISTLEIFSSYWLPLLQILTVSQNSLIEIVPLFQFVSLEKLDVSNNCLSDLTGVTKWFDACFNLCDLSLIGNPLLQERNWRHSILEILPTLRILNGETVNSDSFNNQICTEPGSFSAICQTQTQELNLIVKKCVTEKRSIHSSDAIEDLCCYFNELMKLSSEYRNYHEHENFKITERDEDLNTMEKDQSEVQQDPTKKVVNNSPEQNNLFVTEVNENQQDFLKTSPKIVPPDIYPTFITTSKHEQRERTDQDQRVHRKRKSKSIKTTKIHHKFNPVTETLNTTELEKNFQHIENDDKKKPKEGYSVQMQINFCTIRNMAAVIIQRAWRNFFLKTQIAMKKRKCSTTDMHTQREKAATRIQAVWKGFLLRKKLAKALASIKNEVLDGYEEINLDDFTFDETALEKEWLSLDSTDFPSKIELQQPKHSGYLSSDDTSLNLPCHPDQAWQCNERGNPFSPEDFQFSGRSESQNLSTPSDFKSYLKMSLRSKKEEKISEEWGFKDISTAQLMLKRAQKMKSKKAKHKLDPAVRLALFKNNGSKYPSMKAPKKKGHLPRHERFEEDVVLQFYEILDRDKSWDFIVNFPVEDTFSTDAGRGRLLNASADSLGPPQPFLRAHPASQPARSFFKEQEVAGRDFRLVLKGREQLKRAGGGSDSARAVPQASGEAIRRARPLGLWNSPRSGQGGARGSGSPGLQTKAERPNTPNTGQSASETSGVWKGVGSSLRSRSAEGLRFSRGQSQGSLGAGAGRVTPLVSLAAGNQNVLSGASAAFWSGQEGLPGSSRQGKWEPLHTRWSSQVAQARPGDYCKVLGEHTQILNGDTSEVIHLTHDSGTQEQQSCIMKMALQASGTLLEALRFASLPTQSLLNEVDDEEHNSEDVPISSEKTEHSKELTYQWLHTQVGSYETTLPKNVKCQSHFLPVLDPDVLNGGRVQLVARLVRREDMDVDLVSMNTGNALAQNREKNNQASRYPAESSCKLWFHSMYI
ncbi:leucine-rich repeat and IQ domain-containing protein 1 [Gracilinanus agilis]|uniref:leucine-rich repeat and IQ domain-containing protein 1 n=1 Tax=Gracilinanus agilis TaxID=191870 RepID=UPI001CFF45BD|nr:leucine-rich repeat and IQ domain-containing protein 1 [Gracilinanus agilis]